MRILSPTFDDECAGTTSGDRIALTVWRGARQAVKGELDVTAWSFDWDAGRQVQGQATFTIADPTGRLAPWVQTDPLGPGGSRVRPVWVSGLSGIRVPLGVWRIREADPIESWRLYRAGGQVLRVSGGGSVTIHADEETSTAGIRGLDATTRDGKATVLGEIVRLMGDVCAVKAYADITDIPVPADYVYGDSLLDTLDDLCDMVGAVYRFDAAGVLELVPRRGVPVDWTIAGGDDGVLVAPTRTLSDSGIYNTVVSSSTDASGAPIVRRAVDEDGALGARSPFGVARLRHNAPGKTEAAVQADADSMLALRSKAGDTDLSVLCLAHPGVQLHDVVTLVAPSTVGEHAIAGRVVKMTLSSATGGFPAKTMKLTLRVYAGDLAVIAARVNREG